MVALIKCKPVSRIDGRPIGQIHPIRVFNSTRLIVERLVQRSLRLIQASKIARQLARRSSKTERSESKT